MEHKDAKLGTPWPNQREIIDGVVPTEEIPQVPDLPGLDDDLDLEMEV